MIRWPKPKRAATGTRCSWRCVRAGWPPFRHTARTLEPLADRVDELREPLATAQLQRFRAILASTRGQFADALEIAERGQSEFLRTGQAIAAAQHAGLRPAVMVREKSPCRRWA